MRRGRDSGARLRTEALLLRCVDFSESDRVVHLLTPELGRVTAIAKGARRSVKRFPGTLDIFNHVRVQVVQSRRGHMARLEQALLISPFLGLRAPIGRFALGCYLLELLDRQAPEGGVPQDMRRLFSFAHSVLRLVETSAPDRQLRTLLELRVLDALGLRPELALCVRCGRRLEGPRPIGFEVAEGGPICSACESDEGLAISLRVGLGTLRALEQALRFEPDQLGRLKLSEQALAEAGRLVTRFQRFHLCAELRSERFLNEILRTPRLTPADA